MPPTDGSTANGDEKKYRRFAPIINTRNGSAVQILEAVNIAVVHLGHRLEAPPPNYTAAWRAESSIALYYSIEVAGYVCWLHRLLRMVEGQGVVTPVAAFTPLDSLRSLVNDWVGRWEIGRHAADAIDLWSLRRRRGRGDVIHGVDVGPPLIRTTPQELRDLEWIKTELNRCVVGPESIWPLEPSDRQTAPNDDRETEPAWTDERQALAACIIAILRDFDRRMTKVEIMAELERKNSPESPENMKKLLVRPQA